MPDPDDEGEKEMSEQVIERVTPSTAGQRHVRVWFGQHVIAQYTAEPELAERYANAMGRRFAGLKITNDPVPGTGAPEQQLPSERLWDIPPQ